MYNDIPNEDFDGESPIRLVRPMEHTYEKDFSDEEIDSNEVLEKNIE